MALAILTGIVLLRLSPYLITAGILLLAGLTYPRALRPLTNYRFWITIGLLVLIVPVFTGSQDRTFLGITYSSEMLIQTILMSMRAIMVFLLFQVLTYQLKSERIAPFLSKIGIKHFDTTYDLSQKVSPRVKSILMAQYGAFRDSLRKKGVFRAAFHLAGDTLADFVVLANQLSRGSMESSAPDPAELCRDGAIAPLPALIVVVGDSHSGKTLWLKELIAALTAAGKNVDGLIAEKIVEGEDRWHQVLKRIATDEARPLNTMDPIETPIKTCRFSFYPEAITWGCEQLAAADTADWLIVDEIGLLEMEGGGLLPPLQKIVTGFSGRLVLSMRTSLFKHLDSFLAEKLPPVQAWPRYVYPLSGTTP